MIESESEGGLGVCWVKGAPKRRDNERSNDIPKTNLTLTHQLLFYRRRSGPLRPQTRFQTTRPVFKVPARACQYPADLSTGVRSGLPAAAASALATKVAQPASK